MTSVAVAPGSLGAPPSMLTPQMYHLQQGLSPTSGSSASGKVSRKRNSSADISDLQSRSIACRMRDASYAGVLHNGTKPRLKSWNLDLCNLIRRSVITEMPSWCGISSREVLKESFSGVAFHRAVKSQLDAERSSFHFLEQGKSIDSFSKILLETLERSYDDGMQYNVPDTR